MAASAHLNLIGVSDPSVPNMKEFCVMEKPIDKIANAWEVTTLFVVPISISIITRVRVPKLSIIGRQHDESVNEMSRTSERRLDRRAKGRDESDLYDLIFCEGRNSRRDNYATVKLLISGDDYLIKYTSQKKNVELSFTGNRSLRYHLAFGCEKQHVMVLCEDDFKVFITKQEGRQPWSMPARDVCACCCSNSVTWMTFPCHHRYCDVCAVKMHNQVCVNRCTERKESDEQLNEGQNGNEPKTLLDKEKAVLGYLDDGFCVHDDCMEREVVNLPCKCITCEGPGVGKKCSRCLKDVDQQIRCYNS